LWGGLVYGCIMGMARIIQGGHFLSDVLWSAGFVYLTALVLAAWLLPDEPSREDVT
jgi:membrane-associated PAP2 superfamily phosphatase